MNEVFHKLPQYLKADDIQAAIDRKEAVDMSKISDTALNATIHHLQKIHQASTGFNASIINDDNEQVINDTGIEILNETRRQILPWHGVHDRYWNYATDYMARQKILDCMLTLIYMARHHVLALTVEKPTRRNSPYRMAYLWSKIDTLHNKIKTIYKIMKKKTNTVNEVPTNKSKYLVTLHRKALKTHTQFNFYYFIIARMHQNLLVESVNTTTLTVKKQRKNISFKTKNNVSDNIHKN